MNDFPWLKDNIDQWFKLIKTQNVPHAILLSGAKGLAKTELAAMMAHIAICENLGETAVCNTCKGCQLFNAGNHTDITTIKAEKSVIKVDQIRKLSKNVVLSSTRNSYRVMIIENAENMNKASANALLKTLEEPPANVILILTTSEIGYLLATIKSRCFKINIKSNDSQQISQWLQNIVTSSQDEINQALMLSNDAPIDCRNILVNNKLATVKLMLSDLNQLATNQTSILETSKKWLKEECIENLPMVAAYFLNLLKANNSLADTKVLQSLSNANYSSVRDLDKKTLDFLKKIYAFMSRLRTSLKPELMLEELLISWQKEFFIRK